MRCEEDEKKGRDWGKQQELREREREREGLTVREREGAVEKLEEKWKKEKDPTIFTPKLTTSSNLPNANANANASSLLSNPTSSHTLFSLFLIFYKDVIFFLLL